MIKTSVSRDSSRAVINRDALALEEYKAKKAKNREIKDMKDKLNILEKRISDLEALVKALT